MKGFSAEWLDLREPLDAASRNAGLGARVLDALGEIQVVDLGAGTGANLRYLAPLIEGSQEWLLVDRDASMLNAVNDRMRAWASPSETQVIEDGRQLTIRGTRFECHVHKVALDLATEFDRLELPNEGLVSASALLDLVSEDWIRRLAERTANAAAAVWFALTYDGRIDCSPAEPEDPEVRELFNRHQVTDKGFGPALGPNAARMAEQIFGERGYRTLCAPSDWRVEGRHHALQHAIVDGWFDAACEVAPARTPELRKWRTRRRAHIDAGRSELIVGHVDMVGWKL